MYYTDKIDNLDTMVSICTDIFMEIIIILGNQINDKSWVNSDP